MNRLLTRVLSFRPSVLPLSALSRAVFRPARSFSEAAPQQSAVVKSTTKALRSALKLELVAWNDLVKHQDPEALEVPEIPKGFKVVHPEAAMPFYKILGNYGTEQFELKVYPPEAVPSKFFKPENEEEETTPEPGREYENDVLEIPIQITFSKPSQTEKLCLDCVVRTDKKGYWLDLNAFATVAPGLTQEEDAFLHRVSVTQVDESVPDLVWHFMRKRGIDGDELARFILSYNSWLHYQIHLRAMENVRNWLKH